MSKHRIGEIDPGIENLVLYAGIGFGAYLLIKNGIPSLFGGGDPASNSIIAAEKSLAPTSNPFNPMFAPWVNFYNNNAPVYTGTANGSSFFANYLGFGNTGNVGQPVTMSDFFNNLTAYGTDGNGNSIWSTVDVVALSTVYQNVQSGISGGLTSNEAQIVGALGELTSQIQCAFIAGCFYYLGGSDMLTALNGSIFQKGTTPAGLAQIITNVNALPVGD